MRRRLAALLLAALVLLCGCQKKADPYADVPNPIATITMADGQIMRFELQLAVAPNTVANFTSLANSGFYDGLEFFRVVPGVLIQSGDPNNDGTGCADGRIRGEFSANGFENDLKHTRGVISMARSQSYDSAGSQFFIMHADASHLDGQYAAFGKITDDASLETLDKIATTTTDASDRPVVEQKIKSITVDTKGYEHKVSKIES